ncbi:MAG TPA: hypothetical protein VJX94_23145 [Stellaceae bacterium]|nr:hypothetical protein [Stellaceae bacterium]
MPLDAQHPPLDFAELDAMANHGIVIESHGLAQIGDIVRHLFPQSGDIRGQFVNASHMPIEARVNLFEPPVDLLEPPVMLTQSSDDIAYLLGDFGQQLIDGGDIGAVDTAHAIS